MQKCFPLRVEIIPQGVFNSIFYIHLRIDITIYINHLIMNDKLNILWTTDNKDTIFNMLSMYTLNSKKRGWWKEVNVILWGASVKLAAQDTQVQTEILEMLQAGVTVEACQDCCERFEVKPIIEKLGVTVRYMGAPLTEYLKNGEKILTL